tara:strand:- start:976 stop:1617 length:642 start_codon:yes stop_codon:yes gene_type:complete
MTLPNSGSLSYNSIRAEFGSPSSNVYLSLYFRGGSYTTYLPENANIPTGSSSTIAVNDFYGATGSSQYAFGTGGNYNAGGKAQINYRGIGGPSLPGMQNSSIRVGNFYTNCNAFYRAAGNTGIPDVTMSFGGGSSQFSSRLVQAKSTNSGVIVQGNLSAGCGTGGPLTNSGAWNSFTDQIYCIQNSQAAPNLQPNNNSPGITNLNQYFYIDMF